MFGFLKLSLLVTIITLPFSGHAQVKDPVQSILRESLNQIRSNVRMIRLQNEVLTLDPLKACYQIGEMTRDARVITQLFNPSQPDETAQKLIALMEDIKNDLYGVGSYCHKAAKDRLKSAVDHWAPLLDSKSKEAFELAKEFF